MKKLKNLDWSTIIIESILIVLSILLALAINEYRDYRKKVLLREETLSNIKTEIQSNISELEALIENHQSKASKIIEYLHNTDDKDLIDKKVIDVIYTFDQVILKEVSLSTTAWETAQITNAVSLLHFGTIQCLSKVYNLYDISVKKMWHLISNFLLSKENYEANNTVLKLQVFNAYLTELYRQEIYLKDKLQDSLKEL